VSWTHEARLNASDGLGVLREMKITFSTPIHRTIRERRPEAMQVWLEPLPVTTAAAAQTGPSQLFTVHGRLAYEQQALLWRMTDTEALLTRHLESGVRVLIRIHCGVLADASKRIYSATLRALIDFETLPVPGGIFESWFFVTK
jgi:hypothetical protein